MAMYVSDTDPVLKRLNKQSEAGKSTTSSAPATKSSAYVSDTDPVLRRLSIMEGNAPTKADVISTKYSDPLIEAARGGKTTLQTPAEPNTPNLNINAFGANVNAGKRAGDVLGAAVTGGIGNAAEALGQATQSTGLTIGENARLATQGKGTQAEVMKAKGEKADRIRENIKDPLYATADKLQAQSQQYTEAAKEGLGKVGQFAVDASIMGTQLAGDILLGTINPALGTAAMATRVFGGSAQEARQAGATETQQQLYGAASAATSILVEKIAQVGKLFKGAYGGSVAGGSVDDILNKVIGKVVKNPTLQRILGSAIGEGGEEALEAIIQPALQAIYDKGESLNKTWFTDNGEEAKEYLAEVGYNALLGGTLGALGAGGNANVAVQGAETTQNAQNTPPNAAAPRIEGDGDSNAPAPQNGAEAIVGANENGVVVRSSGISALDGEASLAKTLAENLDTVRDMSPVASLTGTEMNDRSKKASEQIRDFFSSVKSVFRQGFGAVSFGEYGVGGVMAHRPLNRAKMVSLQAVPQVIEQGRIISDTPNWKGRGYRSIVFAAPVNIAGTPTYVAAVVNQNPDGKFYLNECVDSEGNYVRIEKAPTDDTKSGVTVQDGVTATPVETSSIAPTVTPPEQNVKRDVFAEDVRNRAAERNDSVGAARHGYDAYAAAEAEYGILPQKDTAIRPDDVPVSIDGKSRNSEVVVNVKGSPLTPDWFVPVLEQEVLKGKYRTVRVRNDETVRKVIDKLSRKTEQEALDDWFKATQKRITQDTTVMGQLLYNNAVQKSDENTAKRIVEELVQMGTDTARALQAYRIMQTLPPETRLEFAKRSVKSMIDKLGIDLDIETDARFKELADAYGKAENDTEADAILKEMAKYVASKAPSTLRDILQTVRYTNMLGNLKTQVRNVAGNATMYGVSGIKDAIAAKLQRAADGADNTRSAWVSKDMRNFGKTVFDEYEDVVLQKGKYQEGKITRGQFERLVQDETRIDNTGIEWLDNSVLRFYQWYNDLTQKAMNNKTFGDARFARESFGRALGGYLQARGVTIEQFKAMQKAIADGTATKAPKEPIPVGEKVRAADRDNIGTIVSRNAAEKTYVVHFVSPSGQEATVTLSENILTPLKKKSKGGGQKGAPKSPAEYADFVDDAITFAANDAQENTFRNANALADTLSSFVHKETDSKAVKALQVMVEALLPFRRTPANIFKAAFDYSPAGLINSMANIGRTKLSQAEIENDFLRAVQKTVGRDDLSANDIIEQMAKGLTGSAIVALGAVLASLGILRGGEDDDEQQAAFDDLRGHQAYSVELGNKSFTLDWLTPASMPLFVGVELYNALSENGISWKDVEGALTSIADPMLEMSMMSGLEDALSNIQYSDNNLIQFALNAATNYLTQIFTNTLAGQLERTLEPNRMTTYVDKNKGMSSWMQYALGKASAKIPLPFMDYGQTEYIDAWGRTESNVNLAQRAFNNFLNPAYTSTVSNDPLEAEIQRLYDATGENVFPERPEKYFTVDGERVDLTAEQYKEYATTRGNELYDLMQKVVESSAYKKASDSGKAEMLSNAKDYADEKAKAEMGYRDGESWAAKADNAGIDPAAYIQYMLITDGLTSDKDANGKTISGSKKEKVLAKINAMNITKAQKDALYRMEGYSENTISDAPWR